MTVYQSLVKKIATKQKSHKNLLYLENFQAAIYLFGM